MANPFAHSVKFLTAVSLLASPGGVTIKCLTEKLDISRRSVFRLLRALEELGVPLMDNQKARAEKTYRLTDSYVLKLPNMAIPNPGLTGEEIELILGMFDLCEKLVKISEVKKLNGIKQKITAITGSHNSQQEKKGAGNERNGIANE